MDLKFKLKVRNFQDIMRLQGIDNMKTLETLSVLILIRWKRDNKGEIEQLSWSKLVKLPTSEMIRLLKQEVSTLRDQLDKKLHNFDKMYEDINVLKEYVYFVNDMNFEKDKIINLYKDLVEELLSDNELNFNNHHLAKVMVNLVRPCSKDVILDPIAGPGWLLVEAYKLISEREKKFKEPILIGMESNNVLSFVAEVSLRIQGVIDPKIITKGLIETYKSESISADVILSILPFGKRVGSFVESTLHEKLDTDRIELLNLQLVIELLKPQGRCAILVPEGVLSGNSRAHIKIRQQLVKENNLQAVISLPFGYVHSYGQSFSLLLFSKGKGTKRIWYYDMNENSEKNDKFSRMEENDALQKKFKLMQQAFRLQVLKEEPLQDNLEGEVEIKQNNWFVEVSEIESLHYYLYPNFYRQINEEKYRGEDSMLILEEITKLEGEITTKLKRLESLLEDWRK